MGRTDIHRPSAINPQEYEFVGLDYVKVDSIEDCYVLNYYRNLIQKHMESTGGHYSQHEHGGNCHICGAHCIYTALFYHAATNTYIRTGMDCAEKLDMGEPEAFRTFRKEIGDALKRRAGKAKAQVILSGCGLEAAWDLYNADAVRLTELKALSTNPNGAGEYTWEYRTLKDIVGNLVRYGSISDKQQAFLHKLVKQVLDKAAVEKERDEKRQEEWDAASEAPEGRCDIEGELLSVRITDSHFGPQTKCLIKTVDGWKAWGTLPSGAWDILREGGQIDYSNGVARLDKDQTVRISLTATMKPSDDDPKFGFFSRPKLNKVEACSAVSS